MTGPNDKSHIPGDHDPDQIPGAGGSDNLDADEPLDEDLLRRALAVLGDAVGDCNAIVPPDPTPPEAEPPIRPWWRRRIPVAVAVTGLVSAGAVIAALILSPVQPEPNASGARGLSWEEGIACSRLIVYGNVLSTRPSRHPGMVSATVAVKEWVKPSHGPGQVTFEATPPIETGLDPDPWAPRKNVLVYVSVKPDVPVDIVSGRTAHTTLRRDKQALPRAEKLTCPSWYLHPVDNGGGPAG